MAKKVNKEKKKTQKEINRDNLKSGIAIIYEHPLFRGWTPRIYSVSKTDIGTNTMCIVYSDGTIQANEDYSLSPRQWSYVLAHNILHLAFGHFDADKMPGYYITTPNGTKEKKIECDPLLWNMACDIYITKFLSDIKFGQAIHKDPMNLISGTTGDEIKIYHYLSDNKLTAFNNQYGTAAIGSPDMRGLDKPLVYHKEKQQFNLFTKNFSIALANSVSEVISKAGGHSCTPRSLTTGQKAANWFIDHYPLLGGLATHFKIIEDINFCHRNDIQIAAIDVTCGEIYLNPSNNFSEEEWKFVLAHEYLHAGLQHHNRCNGRNPYLWNVACDFVINSWLIELQVGVMPAEGLLYDPELTGLSAESIYDTMLDNIKKYEKMNTFRGYKKGDIIGPHHSASGNLGNVTLDEFCKNALSQGLEYHQSTGRGLIPAGLIEEIRALSMPPIPWDVALAKWFDIYFAPLEKHRSYSRPSRRQASTPDIPRPRYITADVPTDSRTFGVVVDTSGSMDAKTIGKALGTIASYSVAHDVPFARVVFCDAAAYDMGYISPEDIAGRVAVKGRGGTTLQPGINTLEAAKDFPKDGPILIITDGEIEEHLAIKHEHAFLLPRGKRLPFRAKGKIFYFSE